LKKRRIIWNVKRKRVNQRCKVERRQILDTHEQEITADGENEVNKKEKDKNQHTSKINND